VEERVSNQTELVVKVLKYDGTEHRNWRARLASREGELVVLAATFAEEVQHNILGFIAAGTISTEYYWLNRWYNVFRFSEPNGEMLSYYCNVNLPPKIAADCLSYVDLDIDVLVQPNLTFQILDTEDFEANIVRYGYTREVQDGVQKATNELVELIKAQAFPFNQ
jgi:protein associated with RNAse G/E